MNKRNLATIILSLLFVTTIISCNSKKQEDQQTIDKSTNKIENKMGTIHLTKEEFLKKVMNYETSPNEWKYLGDKPCLIDFYATWCGPCKTIAPILEELAKEYEGKIIIYKIDTDKEQELAAAFNIRSIPTLLFCPIEGKPQMMQGAMSKADLKKAIDSILLKKAE